MTEAEIQRRLAYYLEWWKTPVIPNAFINDYEMDICSISASGYLIEYEIKTSFADFENDLDKPKWERLRCTEFWYVCPAEIAHRVFNDAPEQFGVLAIVDSGSITRLRKARRLGNPKLEPHEQIYLLSKLVPKYWRTIQPQSYELIQWYESAHQNTEGGGI